MSEGLSELEAGTEHKTELLFPQCCADSSGMVGFIKSLMLSMIRVQ